MRDATGVASRATDVAPWEAFADAVLQQQALICRLSDGQPARELAGLYVDDADVERILRSLPGLRGADRTRVDAVVASVAPQVERARTTLRAAGDAATPFFRIARAAHLEATDIEVFALIAAVEREPRRQRLVAYLQDSVALATVTLSLLRRIVGDGERGPLAAAPLAPLQRSRLIATTQEGAWSVWTVRLAPRVAWALAGDDAPDPGLPHGTMALPGRNTGDGDAQLVFVHGGDRVARRAVAQRHLAAGHLVVASAPADASGYDALVREAVVTGAAIVIEVADGLSAPARTCIAETGHLSWAVLSPRPLPLDTMPERRWTEVAAPPALIGPAQWQQAMGEPDGHGHRLTREQLDLVARAAVALGGDASAAVRRLASGQLEHLALHVPPRRGWADLVLPPDRVTALRELAARYRHRRLVHDDWGFRALPSAGLVALFSGPSGTGKTLAAEVVAGDLGLDVYKIDLSAVVSKYIGETEKNLERIFSAAACANVVLFFDEADALFGKRSDVGDAHDRYANIEVSYLLQRLEAYDGLVVLATNLQRNMDAAFLRRIHVAVEFGLPDEDSRRAIWGLSFPPRAPTHDLDLDFLARQFKLSGGSIRNAAMAAAFLAAADAGVVEMPHVMRALKREFQKLGRLRTETEFERYFPLVHADER